jgi:hypothetical protein
LVLFPPLDASPVFLIELIRHCFFTVGVYEEGFCVSREFLSANFDHKIWGAVSVMMEGVYWVGQSSG